MGSEMCIRDREYVVGFRKLTWEELAELVEIAICSSEDPMTLRFEDSVQCDHPAPLYQARLTGSLVVDSPFRRDSVDEPHALRSLINTMLRLGRSVLLSTASLVCPLNRLATSRSWSGVQCRC